ncbi:MAG: DcaP family trimeric outer membrane transporter [Rikenellaceae bacterium]
MKKKLLLSVLSLLAIMGTTTVTNAQEFFLSEGTEILVPWGDAEFDEQEALAFFTLYHHEDYMAPSVPKFVITDKKARAMFTIGGFVNFRTAYDFNYVMPNLDFVPADINIGGATVGNRQRALMDASTSRLFFESVVKTRCGKPITAYVETDFRGDGNTLRLRQAYISFNGLKFGQATSTFTDVASAYNTIDFEGPNAFSYTRNLLIQYTKAWNCGFEIGVGLEFPKVQAMYNNYATEVYQKVPDIPLYMQYSWGESTNRSHIRASGIMRNMYYADQVTQKTVDNVGWGAQLSGRLAISDWGCFYGQALYGKGISTYIQDLQGYSYDMNYSSVTDGVMLDIPAMAWFAGMEINLTERMPLTLGYSQVRVYNGVGLSADDYKLGQYVVANCFYSISRFWSVGVEYLYGAIHKISGSFGRSNRAQAAVQFNF